MNENGEFILYTSEDGRTCVQLRTFEGSVWLSQAEIAELFSTTAQNITQHLRTIFEDGELTEAATCKNFLQVRLEGHREVQRTIGRYSLDAILAVGYRVHNPRAAQFRQ